MSFFSILRKARLRLEKIHHDFLRGSQALKKKMNSVKWPIVWGGVEGGMWDVGCGMWGIRLLSLLHKLLCVELLLCYKL